MAHLLSIESWLLGGRIGTALEKAKEGYELTEDSDINRDIRKALEIITDPRIYDQNPLKKGRRY
jgi:hypothetical protein